MKKKASTPSDQAAELRRRAEDRLRTLKSQQADIRAEADARALVHELQVHQIELEMQNEELKQARMEAEEALGKYHDLFDFAPVGYYLWDEHGRILEVNLAGAALLGLERSAARQMRFGQFVVVEHRRTFVDFLQIVLATDAKRTCEVILQRNGSAAWVLIEGVAAQDRQLPQALCRAAVIDITQQKRADELAAANGALRVEMAARKQAEEELRAAKHSAEVAKNAAEQANRTKDRFLAALSHELRTPLTPVVMGVSMLQQKPGLDAETRATLEMVGRNVQMETLLIDDLLDLARIAHGSIQFHRRPVKLCSIIDRAVEVCKADIEARGLEFSLDVGPCSTAWVEADAARLQQVFWNLLKNAVKFTPHGGRVGIRCRSGQDRVVIEVSDSGIGIEPEVMPRIFDAFEQLDGPGRRFDGLGLGLGISRTLVQLHGGTMTAQSEGQDKGATFRVELPLTTLPSEQVHEASHPETRPRQVTRPLRILLVEDHSVTAKMIGMVLTEAGHTVETAGDVATAVELAGRHTFDLLVSDLGLPDGSGHDLLRKLRDRRHRFPGIALTGYGQEEDIQRSRDAGFAAHLTKPASREAVIEAVAAAVAGQPARAMDSTLSPPHSIYKPNTGAHRRE